MSDETYPKNNIILASNGASMEIQASDTITVKSEINTEAMNNLASIWIANRLQIIDLLQQEVSRLNSLIERKASYAQETETVVET